MYWIILLPMTIMYDYVHTTSSAPHYEAYVCVGGWVGACVRACVRVCVWGGRYLYHGARPFMCSDFCTDGGGKVLNCLETIHYTKLRTMVHQ